MSARTRRPEPAEYQPYYNGYVSMAPDGDPVATMMAQIPAVVSRFSGLPNATAGYAYAPGKWTVREVVGHLIDTERVFSYRATAFSRADVAPLPGYDQALWNPYGQYHERPLDRILDEWVATRKATIALADALPDNAWDRTGIASGYLFSVRALIWILPGHVNYHLAQVADRYGLVG